MVAQKKGGAGAHGVYIQRVPGLPDQAGIMGYRGRAANEPKQVVAANSGKARMPVLIHLPTIEHRNAIGFQMIIQRAFQLYCVPRLAHIAMSNLSQPVYTRVGAPSGRYAGQVGL